MSKNDKLTDSEFKKRLYEKFNGELIALQPYINNKTAIKIKNIKTGYEKLIRPDNLFKTKRAFTKETKQGGMDPSRREKIILTKYQKCHKNFDEISKKISNQYELIKSESSYINNKASSITLLCKNCLNKFKISYVNIIQERGCPICNNIRKKESKNIRHIKDWLEKNNIEYECEVRFEDCKNKRTLPFDIKIIINGRIHLIEYDGEFHDYGFNNNKNSLERIKINDAIKTKYCLEHNIPLLRLRYDNFKNYSEMLEKFISV